MPEELPPGLARYRRQIALPEIGPEGQARLGRTAVLLVGAGGLGSAAGFYLAAAGFGKIVIVDPDRVALDNLNRQILYAASDLGHSKAQVAARRLGDFNPDLTLVPLTLALDRSNAAALAAEADLIVDGLDSFAARLVLAEAAQAADRPLVHAGIRGWQGQVATLRPPATPCLACLCPRDPAAADAAQSRPVLGAVAGLAGAIQAAEAVKLATGAGRPLHGRLLRFCALTMRFDETPFRGRADCPRCGDAVRSRTVPKSRPV